MAKRNVSESRKSIYLLGQIVSIVGMLTFGSIFVTSALNFGNFENFDAQGRSFALRMVGGVGLLILGSVLMGIGRAGLAGSGVVLDPEQAREDLEPWSRMAGGMIKDGLDEAGIDIGDAATNEPDFADRLRKLHALHQEGILSDEEYARAKAEALGRD